MKKIIAKCTNIESRTPPTALIYKNKNQSKYFFSLMCTLVERLLWIRVRVRD